MTEHSLMDWQPIRLTTYDYTVGWICALPVELVVAQQMLDEQHGLPALEWSDDNQYSFGRIGSHNVVITCFPKGKKGNSIAGAVAGQLQARFPALRFALMVGVGGGVPSEETDIRLGDVVIGTPIGQYPGVVQYDIGKILADGAFERTGCLAPPPPPLLKAVAVFEAKILRMKAQYPKILEMFIEHAGREFSCPDSASDFFFEPDYDHAASHNESCSQCDKTRAIQRTTRLQTAPRVHFGTIASGNQIIRDARVRDSKSDALGGVLCFEMGAAGVMACFPSLAIRGICNYSDSHCNKTWQPYAAVTAAACAKEILYELAPPRYVARSDSLVEILEATRDIQRRLDRLAEQHESHRHNQNFTRPDQTCLVSNYMQHSQADNI